MVKKKELGEEETQVSFKGLASPPPPRSAGLEPPPLAASGGYNKKMDDPAEGEFIEEAVSLSNDVPVKLVAVLGKKQVVLKDLLKMKVGQTIDLDRPPNEFVDLTANGKLIAKGELVEIDGKLGVRIIKMLK